jgi:2-polyprenyl-3-methyl-5-hydroxy-6-metoxy-1,4-benzoquinol methylase
MADFLYHVFVTPVRWLNHAVRTLAAATHCFQYKVEGALRPSAEWFDHQLDAWWQWPRRGRGGFVDRGVLSSLTLEPSASLLELACGDGFYARHFYAPRAARVLAVDANRSALRHARRFDRAPNVAYEYCDITRGLPAGPFDAVVWNTAIHHFTRKQAHEILVRIANVLAPEGTLSGHTVIEPGSTYEYARQNFSDAEDLAQLLHAVFGHVCVRTTPDAGRLNLYFFAGVSPTALPFDPLRDDVVVLSAEG